jgi:hypothetical protein
MADPREVAVGNRRDQRSKLLQAQAKATEGEKVNFCPYGCEDYQLDEHGYCNHLIGFTNDKKLFEPMVKVKGGRRRVKVPMAATGEFIIDEEVDEDGNIKPVKTPVYRPQLSPVLKTDELVQISSSYRVYRQAEEAKATA